jgi:hypothetical protein
MEKLNEAIAAAGENIEDYTIERKRRIIKAHKAVNDQSGNAALLLIAGLTLYGVLHRPQGGS